MSFQKALNQPFTKKTGTDYQRVRVWITFYFGVFAEAEGNDPPRPIKSSRFSRPISTPTLRTSV